MGTPSAWFSRAGDVLSMVVDGTGAYNSLGFKKGYKIFQVGYLPILQAVSVGDCAYSVSFGETIKDLNCLRWYSKEHSGFNPSDNYVVTLTLLREWKNGNYSVSCKHFDLSELEMSGGPPDTPLFETQPGD
jgi:hypothetical protein